MSNGLFIGDKDPIEIRVGNRKATSVYYSGDNVPQNPVLHISAKGLTTAGIAESGGVVDLSGNGNNGTAYGGVQILDNNRLNWNNNSSQQYISIPNSYDFSKGFSLCVTFDCNSAYYYPSFVEARPSTVDSNFVFCLSLNSFPNRINIGFRDNNNKSIRLQSTSIINQNVKYSVVATYEPNSKKVEIYINGAKNAETTFSVTPKFTDISNILVGKYRTNNDGKIGGNIYSLEIFPYALTSEQVQALYRGIKKVWSNVPDGAILHLNAKGLTTEGIKQTDGIPDLSGNGNNGTAYGGVSVVHDDDLGECFSLAGNRYLDYIRTANKFDIKSEMTISFLMKWSGETNGCVFSCVVTSPSIQGLDLYIYSSLLIFEDRGKSELRVNEDCANKPILFTITSDSTEHKYKIFINGILKATANYTFTERLDFQYLYFGGFTSYNNYKGLIGDIRIYPRALTAHEVKKLYLASRR